MTWYFNFMLRVFLWTTLTGFCYASPLKTEISLNENSPLKQSVEKDPSRLVLQTKITNISDKEQKVPVWICSYGWSWVASTPAIVTGLEGCQKNDVKNIILKPKASYSRDIVVAVSSKAKLGTLTFELGFNPEVDWFGVKRGIDPTVESLKGIVWSNALVIPVTDDMLASALPISDDINGQSIRDIHKHWAGADYKMPAASDKWRQCSTDRDCDSVAVGCWFWVIANKKYLKEVKENMGSPECTRSVPPGPKPVTACTGGICIDKWKSCSQDSDCTTTYNNGWKVVKKEYIKEFQESECNYVKELWKIQCPQAMPSEGLHPVAGCEDKACKLYW